MTKKLITVTIAQNSAIADDIYLLGFRCPELAEAAQPGHFVNFYFPGSTKIFPRPFSIACTEGESLFIMYKVIGSQTAIMSRWPVGEKITVLGILGNTFTLNPEAASHVLLAGGIGIAPLLFVRDRLAEMGIRPLFFVGARSAAQHSLPNDRKSELYLSTDDGSLGFRGNVLAHFESVRSRLAQPLQVYACGPEVMNKAVAKYCTAQGIASQISLEKIMACGVGLCQGCVVKTKNGVGDSPYALVCKHGPVFRGEDLQFDD